jgi:hypothetical protein
MSALCFDNFRPISSVIGNFTCQFELGLSLTQDKLMAPRQDGEIHFYARLMDWLAIKNTQDYLGFLNIVWPKENINK